MSNIQPNVVLVLADNLGWGELGCYGAAGFRGVETPRIDALAGEGLRFLNFNVESDCVPTRSALLTGRHPIRTGAVQSVPAGLPQGIVPWERTLAQALHDRGYATGCFGKWHLGDSPARLPHARGFDEWYGIPRTMNEAMFTSSPGWDEAAAPRPHVMAARAGEPAREVHMLDLEARRRVDAECVARATAFMSAAHGAGQPFFCYVPLTQVHYPTLPHRDFVGSTGAGDFADSLAEMDHRVGELLDAVDTLGLADETVFLFLSDNGPEFRRPWRGTAGPWTGTYHTAMEGSLRVPCILRWPGRVAPGRTTNEVVHVTDLFPTLLTWAGADIPRDRVLDGVEQSDLFLGTTTCSAREGFPFYIKTELRAAKWRHWKMHLVWEREVNDGPVKLESPRIFDLLRDPKEETDEATEANWVRTPIRRMLHDFAASLRAEPPVPPGAPDEWWPR